MGAYGELVLCVSLAKVVELILSKDKDAQQIKVKNSMKDTLIHHSHMIFITEIYKRKNYLLA